MHKHELPVPSPALHDPNARELVRVWAAAGTQQVAISTRLWKDPAAWGVALVDLSRHVARAYVQSEGLQEEAVLRRIREAFDAEWSAPTDRPTGSVER
jgi:hypothetical protein